MSKRNAARRRTNHGHSIVCRLRIPNGSSPPSPSELVRRCIRRRVSPDPGREASVGASCSLDPATTTSILSRSGRGTWSTAAISSRSPLPFAPRLPTAVLGGDMDAAGGDIVASGLSSQRRRTPGSRHPAMSSATSPTRRGIGTEVSSSPSSLESQSDSSDSFSATATLPPRSSSSSVSDDSWRDSNGVGGSGVRSRGVAAEMAVPESVKSGSGCSGCSGTISASRVRICTKILNFGAASQMVSTQGSARRRSEASSARSREPSSTVIASVPDATSASLNTPGIRSSLATAPARSKSRCSASRAFLAWSASRLVCVSVCSSHGTKSRALSRSADSITAGSSGDASPTSFTCARIASGCPRPSSRPATPPCWHRASSIFTGVWPVTAPRHPSSTPANRPRASASTASASAG
eukprot:m.116967 g.116967  ORF g.116967 m.116967 type:complete len:410 (+) comp13168_c0_seq1:493-1722(+)